MFNSLELYDMFESSSSEEEKEDNNEVKDNVQFVRNDQDLDDEEFYYKAKIGEIVSQDFKITGKLGKGVYGSVVKAEQISTGKTVAIKVRVQELIPDHKKCGDFDQSG